MKTTHMTSTDIEKAADPYLLRAAAPDLAAALRRAVAQLRVAYNPSTSPIVELDRTEAQQAYNQGMGALLKAGIPST